MTLADPLFYVELAERCFVAAAQCESATGATGLRKLGQNYLALAEEVDAAHVGKAPSAAQTHQ